MSKDVVIDAHKAALNQAKAAIPELRMLDIIELAGKCIMKESSVEDAVKYIIKQYEPAAKVYTKEIVKEIINNPMRTAGTDGLKELADTDFAEELKDTAKNVFNIVKRYHNKELNDIQFLEELLGSNFADVNKKILKGCGIDLDKINEEEGTELTLSSPAVSYMALSAAYEILMASLEDASIAYEHRKKIEAECERSIQMMKDYRRQMELAVSKYMTEHTDGIRRGFAAIDQAILDQDVNGFIRGNAEIQKMLKYDIQFTSQKEFDELMDSEDAFKL